MDCFGVFLFVSHNSPLIIGENQLCNSVRDAKKTTGKKGFVLANYTDKKKIVPLKPANAVNFYMQKSFDSTCIISIYFNRFRHIPLIVQRNCICHQLFTYYFSAMTEICLKVKAIHDRICKSQLFPSCELVHGLYKLLIVLLWFTKYMYSHYLNAYPVFTSQNTQWLFLQIIKHCQSFIQTVFSCQLKNNLNR